MKLSQLRWAVEAKIERDQIEAQIEALRADTATLRIPNHADDEAMRSAIKAAIDAELVRRRVACEDILTDFGIELD